MTTAVPLSEWSGKLPAWASTSDGAVSEHPTPDYLTSVRDGSVLLPTPTRWVQGEVDLDKYLARREREKAKGRNGNGFGLPLDMALRLLPTPTVNDSKNNPPSPSQLRRNSLALPALMVTLAGLTSAPTSPQSDGRKQRQVRRSLRH